VAHFLKCIVYLFPCCREEIDALFARLPPREDGSAIESTESHPLIIGRDVSTLPPVAFPEVRELEMSNRIDYYADCDTCGVTLNNVVVLLFCITLQNDRLQLRT